MRIKSKLLAIYIPILLIGMTLIGYWAYLTAYESVREREYKLLTQTLSLTFQLAGITTLLLLFIGIPIAYFLAYTQSKTKPVLETIVSMPLVLPPTVLGFYLLITLSPESTVGGWLLETFNIRLIFSSFLTPSRRSCSFSPHTDSHLIPPILSRINVL